MPWSSSARRVGRRVVAPVAAERVAAGLTTDEPVATPLGRLLVAHKTAR